MNKLVLLLIAPFLLLHCSTTAKNASKPSNTNTPSDSTPLIDKLVNGYYGDLFNYMVREDVADKVWEDASYEQLVALAKEKTAPMKARFFACEVLEVKQFTYKRDIPEGTLAQIYAQALANNYTGYANSWGFLYEHNDEGTTGIMFLELWDKAVPALIPLLEDETQHLYHGSREATMGNAYRFRVKDFAAYYIGKITRIPVKYHNSLENRDKEIAALKVALKDYKPE